MKPAQSKAIIEDCRKRGYIEHAGVFYPPDQAEMLKISPPKKSRLPKAKRTGWIDDDLNIRNKMKYSDPFIILVKHELNLEVWPEFYFTLEKQYRFDYAIPIIANSPQLKIAIECEGGIWAKGNSGHSSGTGIMRDMDKGTLANINGWTLIRRTPAQLVTMETIDLIKKALNNSNICN